jgi:hypothetical protein
MKKRIQKEEESSGGGRPDRGMAEQTVSTNQ